MSFLGILVLNAIITENCDQFELSLESIEKSYNMYCKFNKSFGPVFLVFFPICMLLTISNLFFIVSSIAYDSEKSVMLILSMTFSVASDMLNILSISKGLHMAHESLLNLALKLDQLEQDRLQRPDLTQLQNLRRRLLNIGPITALGYFNLNKNAFVGYLSFVATYVVILVQFKSSENND